jgi:hypothetical protein
VAAGTVVRCEQRDKATGASMVANFISAESTFIGMNELRVVMGFNNK